MGTVLFPSSGVETYVWLPPLVALVVSFFTSMAGLSGAFVLLPFQMSVLGFVSPAVSPTNLVFNVVAIPSGVCRYLREGRMVWPLTWMVIAGTLPGVVAGGLIRLHFLPEPGPFKAFVGFVLLYIGLRMVWDLAKSRRAPANQASGRGDFRVQVREFSWRLLRYEFEGTEYRCSAPGIFVLSLVVGVVGGIYGIGGGAIIAPVFVAIYGLPVHTVAGATLMGTLVTSIVGVAFYQLVAPYYGQMDVAPDWALGALFGAGGLAGMYLGARMQRWVPAKWIKALVVVLLAYLSVRYIGGLFVRD